MVASVARAAAAASGCPPKVEAWSPGLNALATSSRAQQAPIGTPFPRALATVTTSGCGPVVLEAPPSARAAEPGLDFVHNEQDAALVAERAHALEVLLPGRPDPSLTLDRLEQYGRHLGRHRSFESSEIPPGDVAKTVGQGLERFVLSGLAGGMKGGQRPPVERPVRAQHHVTAAAPPLPGQLDGALVCLGAAVSEKDLSSAAEQPVEDHRYFFTRQRAEQVGGVHQSLRGLAHRLGHSRVRMAKRGHREPGQHVQVPAPLVVPEVRTLSPYKRHARRRVCRHQICQSVTIVPIPLRVKISSSSA